MDAPPFTPVDFMVEPDLQPLYPTNAQISDLLSPQVGLAPSQKAELVAHCVARACVFADLSLLSFLLQDPQAQQFVDLSKQDEDGLGLISTAILGFGSESDRDIEREECVRLLVSEGCDVNVADIGTSVSQVDSCAPQKWTSRSRLDPAALRLPAFPTYTRVISPHAWIEPSVRHQARIDCTGYRDCALHCPRTGRCRTTA